MEKVQSENTNGEKNHGEFGAGKNSAFNRFIKEIKQSLSPKDGEKLDKSVKDDQNSVKQDIPTNESK